EDEGSVEIIDFKSLALRLLDWPEQEWVEGEALEDRYRVRLKESPETIPAHAALRFPKSKTLEPNDAPYQLLIRYHDGDFDTPYEAEEGHWLTTASRRMERLLRESGVPIGLLVSKSH